jgi:hypothetical protein
MPDCTNFYSENIKQRFKAIQIKMNGIIAFSGKVSKAWLIENLTDYVGYAAPIL